LVKKVRESAQMGYQKMKIKIKPDRDRDYLKMVRKELGDAVPIMADANNAYALADVHRLKELDGFHLMMIEQPLAWDDLLDHSELQKQLKTPVCLDESISGIGKAREMVKLASGRIVNIKPGRVGGLAESVAIHDFCQANRIPVWCGGMLESGIGRAYNVALASLHNFVFPGDISPSKRYWAQDVVSPAWDMDAHGRIAVPFEKRGLGVEIDTRRIESLTAEKIELK
jgi:O-succinylbenzoate synthase